MLYRRFGFTLVELMIVMVVIGILSVALMPQISGYLARGRDTDRIGGMKQIAIAIAAYQVNKQILPTGTGTSDQCVDASLLKSFYVQKFPVDPIVTRYHWGCSMPWSFGYGTWTLLVLRTAVLSAYLENPHGWNTGSIEIYQGNSISKLNMDQIHSFQKGTGSWYITHN